MRLRSVAALVGMLSVIGVRAGAQITNVQTTFGAGNLPGDPGVISSGPTGGAYYVGPYTGSINLGATTIPVVFNCVDFFHDVTNGERWVSNLVNLGTGAGIGTTDANSLTRLYGTVTVGSMTFSALDVYRAAAFLTTRYPTLPSKNAKETSAIQSEIWEMTSLFYPQVQGESSPFLSLDPTPGIADGSGTRRTDGYSFSAPRTAAQLASDIYSFSNRQGFDYDNYWVVTAANSDQAGSAQEFVMRQTIATPEPGTFVLLGSGMMSLIGGGVIRRRRRTKDDLGGAVA